MSAGVTPWTLWPDEWFKAATRACEARGCEARFAPSQRTQRYCSKRCGKAEWAREKYASDAEYAERERARRRGYYWQVPAYERAQSCRRKAIRKGRRSATMGGPGTASTVPALVPTYCGGEDDAER